MQDKVYLRETWITPFRSILFLPTFLFASITLIMQMPVHRWFARQFLWKAVVTSDQLEHIHDEEGVNGYVVTERNSKHL
jgi:hypothetical protein